MPHILDLANEILCQIITATNPHDIESLAASCKTINILAQPELERHHKLKKTYANLAFRDWGYGDDAPGIHPIYVLRDVLHDTAVAQYPSVIRSTQFLEDNYDWGESDPSIAELSNLRAVALGCEKEIENAIYQCPFIEIVERETWKAQIMQGKGEVIIGLLLTLLPHLISMVIVQRPASMFMKMFKRIVELRQPPNRHATQALTKLIRIDTVPYYSENAADTVPAYEFDYLSQYMLLPSMRKISDFHFKIGVGWDAQSFQWRHKPGISPVTEINIDHSMVDGESITNLLRGVRALESFSFTFGSIMPDKPLHQSRKIINGLKQYAKCSLSYLHLTGTRAGTAMHGDDLEYDLRCFEKLRQLHIDHTLLTHHNRPCLALFKRNWDKDCNCWPQRLVDVLSASLESLKLVGSAHSKRVRAFFAGFPELKAERLPRLREIEMRGSAATELRFVRLCKEVGVILSQNEANDDVHYQCS